MEYTVIYKIKRNGNIKNLKMESITKAKVYEQLRGNGFRTLGIYTEKQIQEILTKKWYDIKEGAEEYIRQCI